MAGADRMVDKSELLSLAILAAFVAALCLFWED